ncbi:MAG: hypothetical protein ABEJ31_13085 [Haloarculaceae archaeon]
MNAIVKGAPVEPLGEMDLSRAVRSIRDDTVPDAAVTLLVTVADDSPASVDSVEAALEAAAEANGGQLAGRRPLDTVAVTVPQTAIDDVCAVEGISHVETEGALATSADGAGEDVTFGDE